MTKPRQTVAIVGAGIGGLTAALAFARNGAEVFVFEKAAALDEVGAGIQITPNAAKVLHALGLMDEMEDASIAAHAVVPTDAVTGRTVTRFDLTRQSPRYRFFHRARLQGMLCDAAQAAGVQMNLGVAVTDMSQSGVLETTNGPVQADVVVGADGIHSVLRRIIDPSAQDAVFMGQVAWRAMIPAQNVPAEARIWMAPHRHVVTYPLMDNMLNIVAVQERDAWAREGWNHPDDPAHLQAAFADCAPNLRHLLSNVRETSLWGLYRHEVAAHWSRGCAVLLGDAAHPTLPFLAQGANLAIEDAFVLARCCDEAGSVAEAFGTYQALRQPRVIRAINAANANAKNYHLSGTKRRVAFTGLKALGLVAPNAFLNRLSWLYGHDVTR